MHPNSELIFKKYAASYFAKDSYVLELGPDRIPSTYHQLFPDIKSCKTLDFPRNGTPTDYVMQNEYVFPIPDNTFDIVFSGQDIEHVRKIWVWSKELALVCKVGNGLS